MTNLHARDRHKYKIAVLCGLLGVSKQAYHQHDNNKLLERVAMEAFALEYAREQRMLNPGIGMMKLWHMYRRRFSCERRILGRDRFTALLAEAGMKVRQKRRRPRTTDSSHGLPVFPNLVVDLLPTGPDQLWVSDITYIEVWVDPSRYMFCYLSLIMDAYTKEIIGWSVGPTLEATYPIEALRMALPRLSNRDTHPVHHSDRGVQYASKDYVDILSSNQISISMTERGDPKENAQAERVNNTMKNELLKDKVFRSIKDVQDAVANAVDYYNNQRPHMSLDMMTPLQASLCHGEIRKCWHSWREDAIKAKQNTVLQLP